jgi:outer membrane lipoprotein
MNRVSILFVIGLLLQGCTYAISPAVTSQADRTVLFESLQNNPDHYKGRTLIFGGTITQLIITKQGTIIEIAQKTLDYWGKPERTMRSRGVFRAFYPSQLNALLYTPGTDITVAGALLGSNDLRQGDDPNRYPTLHVREMKLWVKEKSTWDKPQWMDPLYDPDSAGRRDY